MGAWQVRVKLQIEARHALLKSGQRDHLDCIKADRPHLQRAATAHSTKGCSKRSHSRSTWMNSRRPSLPLRLHQPANAMHRFGQHPAIERRRLIKGTRLLLQQRQIMQRVGDEVLTLITARVHRDLLPAADDETRST
jgi:hypothetical protein